MKKSQISYDELLDYDLIERTYKIIASNSKHKDKIIKFDLFHAININAIYNTLKTRQYKHSKFNIFLIKEPKYRIVMSESVKDKIVNHLVSSIVLKPILYPKLINENVATRPEYGTAAAIKYCKKYFINMMNKHKKFYILKFDIKKYFYNVDHEKLKGMVAKIYEDDDIKNILYEIIDATDQDYINEEIDKCIETEKKKIENNPSKESKKRLEELSKIPHYIRGKGLGIGSLSSQVFAIFFLNELDHYVKEKLYIKEYIRYMDDGLIFSSDKEYLKKILIVIESYLKDLKLELNSKTEILTSKGGFDFVGYRFKEKNGRLLVRVKNQTKKRIKRKFKNLKTYDLEKLARVKASYKGIMQYCTTKSFYNKNF